MPTSTELKTAVSGLFWLCTSKNKLLVCVCMHVHMLGGESACVSICRHSQTWGGELLLFSSLIPEVKEQQKKQSSSEKQQRREKQMLSGLF